MNDQKDQVKEMLEAIWRRDTDRIASLVAAGVDIHARNDYVLRRACWFGHLPSVQLLLRLGADAKAQNEGAWFEPWYQWKLSGGSPITAAASRGHLSIVEHLHWAGADLHADREGPLRGAAEGGISTFSGFCARTVSTSITTTKAHCAKRQRADICYW